MHLTTMKNQNILYILLLSISILSCGREGCTDCKAINYDSKAKKHDNSCQYEQFVGTYTVKDSVAGPSQYYYYDSYEIDVYKTCSSKSYHIYNYVNYSPNPFDVECEIIGDSIYIPTQTLTFQNNDKSWPVEVKVKIEESKGYLSNDSIYFRISYFGIHGDPYDGNCWGKKK